MSSDWKYVGSSSLASGGDVTEHKSEDIVRVTLGPVVEVSINRFEARRRLATKLEAIAAELRRDAS